MIGILGNVDMPATPATPKGTYKPVLWASAAQFLNDRRELVHGLELVKQYIENVIDPPSGIASALSAVAPYLVSKKKSYLQELCRTISAVIDRTYDTSRIQWAPRPIRSTQQ
ncbi:hypothetical protein [Rhodococcus opacus]|uniref:hypothetical protein n=1 Tax=Rhodococcus opacus TaxID=37919 RepID=UPI0012FDE5D5|nr:hypothetical protein [Rhodococcus opacus]